ncbi:MAG: DPP IV N-terminal domain-containing protein, partial [Flavobacterium sp.]
MTKNIFILAFLIFSISGKSQTLKLEEIMKGESFIGNQPTNGRWSLDGKKVYFEWNPTDDLGQNTYSWQKGAVKPVLVEPKEAVFSKLDFKRKPNADVAYYTDKGGLYSYTISTKAVKKIIQQSAPVSNLELGTATGILFFEQNDNLFKYNAKEGTILQITNFSKGTKKEKPAEKDSFLKTQQKELFQFIKDKEAKKQWNVAKNKAVKSDFAKEYFYGKDNFFNLKANPNGNFATFSLVEESDSRKEKMEVIITDDGYNQTPETKNKVSTSNLVKTKFGIYSVAKDTVYYVNFSTLSHIQDAPKYYENYDNLKSKAKEDKLIMAQPPVYNEDGTFGIVEIRSQDNKDRWLVSLNPENGTFKEIEHQHDDAWIAGPGIPSYSFDSGTLGFLADNETIYFQSEATGYSHLYTYNLKSGTKTQLTNGNWEVRDVTLSKDKKTFYLTTNTTHPGNRNFYKLAAVGGTLEPILTKDGAHEVVVSPDEKSLLVRYSYKNIPWDFYVADNKKNTTLQQISSSTSESFKNYKWRTPEVITFKAQDGTPVNARLYTPNEATANKAAVIFVHGAGYLQNAHNYWSTYHREYMFHNLLTDLGYTVLDIDYRGSDGYGRDFRTGIYRFMGGKDLSD